jgi:ssRNA-specific RNase YbeY (16S rRNA maturation enzyme)
MRRNSEILIYNFEQSPTCRTGREKKGSERSEGSYLTKDKISHKFLKESVKKILNVLPACTDRPKRINSLALVLVSSSEIKKLNYYWRGKNKATTVLTFSEGDVFLCPEEIKKQAFSCHS